MMAGLFWFVLNWIQFLSCVVWTAVWITLAILALVITWTPRIPLNMARLIWAPGILWLAAGRLQIEYDDDIDWDAAHIFVCNHQSMVDIPAAFVALKTPLRFMAKRMLGFVPFIGWYIWATGMVLVDRKNSPAMRASLRKAGRRLMAKKQSLLVFPEGTRSASGAIRRFKKGSFVLAIDAGVPIVPLVVEGSRRVMEPGAVRGRPGTIRVRVGAPVTTDHMTHEDRDQLTALVRAKMIEMHRAIGGPSENEREPLAAREEAEG